MDSALLAQAIAFLGGQRDLYNIHSLSVIRHGKLVVDAAFWPSQPGQPHHISSTTKVVMSALIGIAIDRGYIAGIDEPVLGFFPGSDDRQPRRVEGVCYYRTSADNDLGFGQNPRL